MRAVEGGRVFRTDVVTAIFQVGNRGAAATFPSSKPPPGHRQSDHMRIRTYSGICHNLRFVEIPRDDQPYAYRIPVIRYTEKQMGRRSSTMRGSHPKYRSAPHRVPVRRSQPVPMVRTANGYAVPMQTKVALGKGKPNPKTEEVLFFFPPFFFPPPFFFFGPFSPFGARFFI
jgi:hypothetical protein